MVLLSLASRQIWPQVLAVAHLKPQRLFLIHSEDPQESKEPAQRLKRFFDASGLVPKGGTRLEEISDSNFEAVQYRLGEIPTQHGLSPTECVVNITGGNKLMATAAFGWARPDVRVCYLERRDQFAWFEPNQGTPRYETLDGKLINHLEPVDLLRCQLDTSVVERPGQSLTLNEVGTSIPDDEFFAQIADPAALRNWLKVEGEADCGKGRGIHWSTPRPPCC